MTAVHSDTNRARNLQVPMVLGLTARTATDRAIAGGKAARLAELSMKGFPVPTGFIVTTAALDALIDLAAETSDDAVRHIELASTMHSTPLGDAIRAAYATLGGTVAVRSSAVAEDLADASGPAPRRPWRKSRSFRWGCPRGLW